MGLVPHAYSLGETNKVGMIYTALNVTLQRCMLVHVYHSHLHDERHSALLNPPQTTAVRGTVALGLMRAAAMHRDASGHP